MNGVRAVGAVVAGYVFSQGINGLFVLFWYTGERSLALPLLAALTLVLFAVVGLVTGRIALRVGGVHGMNAVRAVAALIAVVTVGNIVADVALEPLWHKGIVLLVMAPAVLWSARRTTPSDADAR